MLTNSFGSKSYFYFLNHMKKKSRHTEPPSSFKHLPSGNKFRCLMNDKMVDAYGGNPTQIFIVSHLRFLYLSKEMKLIHPQVNTML